MRRFLALRAAAVLLASRIDDSEEGVVGLVDGVLVVVYTPCSWITAESIELFEA